MTQRRQNLLNCLSPDAECLRMAVAPNAELEALASAVARQVDALAHLRFKFEVQQLMLAGGWSNYVTETTDELREAIDQVQRADAEFRRCLGHASARSMALSPESTLREVARAVGEPWRYIFEQGRDELGRAIERINALCAENRKLLARGYLATSDALALLGVGSGAAYDATGTAISSAGTAAILDAKG